MNNLQKALMDTVRKKVLAMISGKEPGKTEESKALYI